MSARKAKKGEKATLLNGKNYELTPDDIVIADSSGVIGLGGVMGGGESEVSDTTTNIVLEAATFDMYAIRKTSMRHGLFTDAVTRFNKGQSPLQNDRALSLAITSILDVAGGSVASPVADLRGSEKTPQPVVVSEEFIGERLGVKLGADALTEILTNVEFEVDHKKQLSVTAPFWRTDIEQAEDIVEEVGRLYGFDKVPRELPLRSMNPVTTNPERVTKQMIRDSLARSGANEVLTYSFVHERTLVRAGQDSARAFRLSNALSPDLQFYRLSLLPSLLEKVHPNIKNGFGEFTLFEIGKSHDKHAKPVNGLPSETSLVEAVYASKSSRDGAAFYQLRRQVVQLAEDLNIAIRFTPATRDKKTELNAPYDLSRTAIIESASGERIGLIGEMDASVIRQFKLPAYSAAFSLDLTTLHAARGALKAYHPLSRFPSVTQDISLKVASDVAYAEVYELADVALKSVAKDSVTIEVAPLSIYQDKKDLKHKTITLRVTVSDYEQTLTDEAVSKLLDALEASAKKIPAVRI